MNMGLLVQDVMYGEKVHRILQEIDLFHAEICDEYTPIKQVVIEIKDCPSFRNLMNEVNRIVAFRIIIREMYFRYTSVSRETIFPIIIVHLLLLRQEYLLETTRPEAVVQAAASETVRWILIGHELGYLSCPDLRAEYKETLGNTYKNWIKERKSAEETIARGTPPSGCYF
ncbi:hypothetical protein LCGC14_0317560 [marine sediment metagenome]|uniref:Uncharacterized protein n=1 Tax=marine sediment metagenome TaxID=412755 RepID=A0A0F9U2G2_9ZZZZ